jgi:hypothetical protein
MAKIPRPIQADVALTRLDVIDALLGHWRLLFKGDMPLPPRLISPEFLALHRDGVEAGRAFAQRQLDSYVKALQEVNRLWAHLEFGCSYEVVAMRYLEDVIEIAAAKEKRRRLSPGSSATDALEEYRITFPEVAHRLTALDFRRGIVACSGGIKKGNPGKGKTGPTKVLRELAQKAGLHPPTETGLRSGRRAWRSKNFILGLDNF